MSRYLDIKDLSIGYRKQGPVFSGISIRAGSGSLIGLLGPNGIGKSTLLRTLAGLQPSLNGTVQWSETLPDGLRTCAFVPSQSPRAAHFSVEDTIGTGRYRYTNWLGIEDEAGKQTVSRAMELAGISHLAGRYSADLSDGEFQRVAIARALVQDTPLIILDEPTAFLDIANKRSTGRLLRQLAGEEDKCIIFSTHDLNLAMEYCHQLWIMTRSGAFLTGDPRTLAEKGALEILYRE